MDAIEAEITKTKASMSNLQIKYDKLAEKLKELEDQKRNLQKEAIMEAFLKSGKSFEEAMTFFNP